MATLWFILQMIGLIVAIACVGLAICPKEFPSIGLVVWARKSDWKNRIFLTILAIILMSIVLWSS